jgi:hypothetical protein
MKRERVLFVIIALVVIFNFVRRLSPIAEASSSAENIITFLADLGMAVGLIGLGVRILKAIPRGSEGRGKWVALLVAGSMAVAGLFVIHARGGPRVELPPRPVNSAASLPATIPNKALPTPGVRHSPNAESTVPREDPLRFLLVLELKRLIETSSQRFEEMDNSRWAQIIQTSDVEQRRSLTHDDFREFCLRQSRYYETLDEGVDKFAEAKAKGISFAEFDDDPRSNPEVLRVSRAIKDKSLRYYALLEANWDEFWPKGLEISEEQAKPWQKEAKQLDAEMDALLEKMKETMGKK